MNKSKKTIGKILFILMISLISIGIINPTSKAGDKKDNILENVKNGKGEAISWSLDNKANLKNDYIYCFQKGQDLTGFNDDGANNKYVAKAKFEISNTKIVRTMLNGGYKASNGEEIESRTTYYKSAIDFGKGLAYILAQGRSGGIDSNSTSPSSDTQLALWMYVKVQGGTSGSGFFHVPSQTEDKDNNAVQWENDITMEKLMDPVHDKDGNYSTKGYSSEVAADIYKTAVNIKNGNAPEYVCNATIYQLIDDKDKTRQQQLLFVESVDVNESKPVYVSLYKQDFAGHGINGAKIEVTPGENVLKIENNTNSFTSKKYNNTDGKFLISKKNGEENYWLKIYPEDMKKSFTLKIKETVVPNGYEGLPRETEVKVKYIANRGGYATEIEEIGNKTGFISTVEENKTAIIINNRPKPKLTLNISKVDIMNNSNLNGAKFDITMSNVKSINGKTGGIVGNIYAASNVDLGNLQLKDIMFANNNNPITVILEERTPPSGYKQLSAPIGLRITRDGNEFKYEVVPVRGKTIDPSEFNKDRDITKNRNNIAISIKNEPKINLIVNKKDYLDNEKGVTGAEFKVKLENVKDVGGTTADNNKYEINNVNLGNLTLRDITFVNKDTPITVILEETKAPEGYKKLSAPIVFTITRTDNGYVYRLREDGENKLDPREFNITSDVTSNQNNITVNIKNIPIISLGGTVWEDKQIGEKAISGPDGIRNFDTKGNPLEAGLEGVLVQLVGPDGSILEKDVNGNDITNIKTNENGYYEFNNIEKLAEGGYKVRFSYDGVNWQETNGYNGPDYTISDQNAVKSDAREIAASRSVINDRFKTISKDTATSIDETEKTALDYEYDSKNNISKLKADMDGTNPATRLADFRANAQTSKTYNETIKNINCGLVNKEFDLSAGTVVTNAKLTINGEEIKQDYGDKANDDRIDLFLYYSDYNYRKDDYKDTTNAGNGFVTDSSNSTAANVNPGDNLEVFVTYKVILEDQTPKYDGFVDEFVYYYDNDYSIDMNVGAIVSGYRLKENKDGKLTFERVDDSSKLTSPNYRTELELTFKIANTETIKSREGQSYNNVVEITKYSSAQGGLVDKDSAPGNANVSFNNKTPVVGQNEDDTDLAQGLDIKIPETRTRTISGTVFEDLNGDGVNDDEKPIDDVIVQLIEVKWLSDNNFYEYIWQETRSGSNKVKTGAESGYTNSVQESGMYEFKGYIPGVYIIRFIYGDGTKYDLKINENGTTTRTFNKDKTPIYTNGIIPNDVRTYNGQDYKSTIDEHYNQSWYNESNYNGKSVARDNEARRLEVMAYSATIDSTVANELNSKSDRMLENTWMAAETSRVHVAKNNDMTSDTGTDTYLNMNFGLAKRPKSELELEKHITGLKLVAKGTDGKETTLVDAKVNSENNITGVTTGLTTDTSTRKNRGWWKVETDIEQLAQGANLEVEYTYGIRNNGDEDYLSSELVSYYNNLNNSSEYANKLLELRNTVRTSMKNGTYSYGQSTDGLNSIGKYLGQWYFNGNTKDCSSVPSRIEAEGLEEAINNDLVFDTTSNDFKLKEEKVKKFVYNTKAGKEDKEIQTVVENNEKTTEVVKDETKDIKKIKLTKTVSSSNGGELGITLPSYIAQITKYSNASGRKDTVSTPNNLGYVHSDDTEMTMDSVTYKVGTEYIEADVSEPVPEGASIERPANEHDEFWGESVIITKPTGEDRSFPVTAIILAISSMAALGVGIILIKKFVLKK